MPNKRLTRDYYLVDVPGDAADTFDALGDIAINEARERARIYAIPANWTATRISGDIGDFVVRFRVCRIRHRKAA